MTTYDIINVIAAGGLLGILGQGIRMAVGLKKHSDVNAQKEGQAEPVDGSRLLISIFIGFIAGALFLLIRGVPKEMNNEFVFSVIAAGYSGTDFIEGLFKTYLSKLNPGKENTTTATPTPTPTPTPAPVTTATTPTLPAAELTANTMSASERDDETSTNL